MTGFAYPEMLVEVYDRFTAGPGAPRPGGADEQLSERPGDAGTLLDSPRGSSRPRRGPR